MIPYINILSAFFTAFIITHIVIPIIINISVNKNLVAQPNERTSHTSLVPNLGGMGIFIGFILSFTLFSNFESFPSLQYFLFAMILIFFLGIKDDITALSASTKFLGLLVAVGILVVLGDVRISSFYGILGIYDIGYWPSVLLTILVFMTIINAVNLIDGIDGLCAILTIISSVAFSFWFILEGSEVGIQLAILSAAIIGSLLAFLRFNVSPAKIFMGDTGSLMLGYILAFMAVMFIEVNATYHGIFKLRYSPVAAIGFLAIPLADMLKVFLIRILRGQSPFSPDKRHVHHLLVDLGLTHMQASFLLSLASIILIGISIALQRYSGKLTSILILLVGFFVVCIPNFINHFKGIKSK
ncbi:MAG TPA: MraY family glycosyltransferase [Salinivirgaceae bacterium]|nr:MraY family glycosyltransferase [Salinivirgaceae bacterium]HQA75593.1 MraY family glycosyltransferase [Salinivirgaceae bacterium]